MANEPENIECSSCGASLRAGASFCHKCGARFDPAPEKDEVSPAGEAAIEALGVAPVATAVSSAWFKEDISLPEENAADKGPEPEFQETMPYPAAAEETPADGMDAEPYVEPEINVIGTPVRAKPARQDPPATAAALRRKPKLQREKIEMTWEQPEGGLNAIFVIGTIIIFVLVLLIVLGVYFVK